MSDDVVIRVENLSKQYRIGRKEGYKTFRETLVDAAKAPFLRVQEAWSMAHRAWSKQNNSELSALRSPHAEGISPLSAPSSMLSPRDDTIWALKDVSFEVKCGEVVGIIGRNGAGKSTLLKILSKITEPTEGRVELRGQVGSLLEVGTGFHPELTGHENVYLYGAILGMDRWEVTRKFDEIIAFAEIEKFIDTPVKRYSSGMYMRLAFAVAAHLEAEILIVDEVLAVGDAQFQKKCLGKMGNVSKEGRTVLFVSHNMEAITSLCNDAILFDRGNLLNKGSVGKVVRDYFLMTKTQISYGERTFQPKPELPILIQAISTIDEEGRITRVFPRSGAITVMIKLKIIDPSFRYHVVIDIKTFDDFLLFRTHSFEQSQSFEILHGKGKVVLACTIPPELFPANLYRVGIITAISGVREIQNVYPVLEFEVIQDGLLGGMFLNIPGVLMPKCFWKRVA